MVTEVTQEEEVEGVSEVVRNINYTRSLTVIYYEILRHLRIDTELAGVRECLFVPFAISPFDLDRAIRWRDILSAGLRKRRLRWAIRHLEDVADNFAQSAIPPGQRADHRVTYATGSLYINLSLERPAGNDEEDEEALLANWRGYSWLFPFSLKQTIARMIARSRARRDAWFQSEIAPTMATRWVNRLKLEAAGTELDGVDFTLATRYRSNRTVRVDFTYSPDEGTSVTRRMLENLVLKADETTSGLPPGSVANLVRAEIRYYTEHFDRRVRESGSTTRDLIDIDSGDPDPAGAAMRFSLTRWELTNLREEISQAVTDLVGHLNEHVEYYQTS